MNFTLGSVVSALAVSLCLAQLSHAQSSEPAESESVEDERRLDILNFRVEGNSVLPRMTVESAVLPFLGPQRPVSDVEKARLALIETYRDNGYETVDVRIPAQDIGSGTIRLEVVEFEVGRLRVEGARYFSLEDIKDQVPSLQEGSVPNYREVGEEIAAVNQSADRLITPSLRAGNTPGTVDVDLFVEDSLPMHGSLELNDRASARTERLRVAAGASYNNLFQLGHSVNLQAQVTPERPEESWIVSASYVVPIKNSPFTVVAYGVHSDSDVAAIGGIDVLGSGDILGLRGIYSKITGEGEKAWIHQVTLGADYKSFEENLLLGDQIGNTPIDYFPFSLLYSQSQRTQRREIDLSLGVNLGIRGLDATDEEFAFKRFGAQANWVTLNGGIGFLEKLESDWRLSARLAAQYSGAPVISNEQFSAGGLDSVRGYYEGQYLGDDGASLQLQIATPSFHAAMAEWMDEARLFAFADGAVLRVYEPLGDQEIGTEISSVGGGIELGAFDFARASILLSKPLIYSESTITDIGDEARVQFRLWGEF